MSCHAIHASIGQREGHVMRDLADVSVRLPPKKPSFLKQPATYSRLVATVPSVWSAIAQGYLQFRLFSVSISTTRLLALRSQRET